MNKVEFQQKLEEGSALIEQNEYEKAVNLFDLLNLDPVRDPRLLQNIAKAYEKCRRYEDAEDLLLQARECAPKSRGALFHLCTLAIKAGNLDDAMKYYNDFCEIAKYDSERFILQYRIAKAKNKSDDELIQILEQFKVEEPDDKWMYELAKLYVTNGRNQEALELCDEIILWFYNGKYVSLAKEMRSYLTGEPIEEDEEPAEEDEAVVQVVTTRDLSGADRDEEEADNETAPETADAETGETGETVEEAENGETEIAEAETEASPADEEAAQENEGAAAPYEITSIPRPEFEEETAQENEQEETGEAISEQEPVTSSGMVEIFAPERTEEAEEVPWAVADEKEAEEAEADAAKETDTAVISEELIPEDKTIPAAKEPLFSETELFEEKLQKASDELEAAADSQFPNQQVFVMDVRTGRLQIESPTEQEDAANAKETQENLKEVSDLLDRSTTELAGKQEEIQQASELLESLRSAEAESRATLATLERSIAEAVRRRESVEEAIRRLDERRTQAETALREAEDRLIRAERTALEAEETAENKRKEAEALILAEAERRAAEEAARKAAEEEAVRMAAAEAEQRAAEEEAARIAAAEAARLAAEEEAARKAAEEEAARLEAEEEAKRLEAEEAARREKEAEVIRLGEITESNAEAAEEPAEAEKEPEEAAAEEPAEAVAEEAAETEPAEEAANEETALEAAVIATFNEDAAEEVVKKDPRFIFNLDEQEETAEAPREEAAGEPAEETQEPAEEAVEETKEEAEEPSEAPEQEAENAEEAPEVNEEVAEEATEERSAEAEEAPEAETPAADETQPMSEFEIYRTIQERISERLNGLPADPELNAESWNILVYGDSAESVIQRAKTLMKAIEELNGAKLDRIVKINALKLADVNIRDAFDQFLGRKVIVEDASLLTDDQVIDFVSLLKEKKQAVMVCFTDTLEHLVALGDRVPMMPTGFTGIFNGNVPTVTELLNAVKKYLDEQDALLTPEAEAEVTERIRTILSNGESDPRAAVMRLAERSLHHAEHSGLFGMFTGHIDDDGFLHVALKHVRKAEEE